MKREAATAALLIALSAGSVVFLAGSAGSESQTDVVSAQASAAPARFAPDDTTTTTTAPPTTTTEAPPPTSPPTTAAPQPPQPVSVPAGAGAGAGWGDPSLDETWDRLAGCESGGDWHINTGNGYYGGLQFALSSWRGVGGTGYPHEHSRETQIEMGRRLWQQGGWNHWPACSSKLGYR